MKYVVTLVLLGFFFTSQAQSKKKRVIQFKESTAVKEMRKNNPSLLDTVYQQTSNGNLQMRIEVAKNLDTIYVEDPNTGDLKMKVVRKRKYIGLNTKPRRDYPTSSDTVYVEDPITGKIRMMITNKKKKK